MSEAYILPSIGKSSSVSNSSKSNNKKTKNDNSSKFETILDELEVKNKSSTDDDKQNTSQCTANVSCDDKTHEQLSDQKGKCVEKVCEELSSEETNSTSLANLNNVIFINQQSKVQNDTNINNQTENIVSQVPKNDEVKLVENKHQVKFTDIGEEVQVEDKIKVESINVNNEETSKNNFLAVENEDINENKKLKTSSFINDSESKIHITKKSESTVFTDGQEENSQNQNSSEPNKQYAKNNTINLKDAKLVNITDKDIESENVLEKTDFKNEETIKNNTSSVRKEEFSTVYEQTVRSTDKTPDMSQKGNINLESSSNISLNEDSSYSKDINTKDMSIIQQMAKSITTSKAGNGTSITVKLKPEYLGDMTINIQNTAQGCIARISAGREEVKRILTSRINEISAVLSTKMVKVDQIVIDNNVQQEANSNNDNSSNGYNTRDFSGGSYNQEYSQDDGNRNFTFQTKSETVISEEQKESNDNLGYVRINYYV